MAGNRVARAAAFVAFLLGAGGVLSPARAQASGTLQATTTVVDDPVSRAVSAELPRVLLRLPDRLASGLGTSIPLADRYSAQAAVRELLPDAVGRRIRIDVVYLK